MQQSDIIIDYDLSPVQGKVLAAIAGGATMQAAAAAAGIHRNTIAYWRRTSLFFRDALCHAHYDKALFIREEAENHVVDAFAAIHTLLNSPDTSDSVRLNAAKYIIEKASTPPPPKPVVTYSVENVSAEIMHRNTEGPAPSPAAAKPEILNSNAQIGFVPPTHPASREDYPATDPPKQPRASQAISVAPPEPRKPEIVHSPAQTVRCEMPNAARRSDLSSQAATCNGKISVNKVGRNEGPCPCGSGLKF